jgi:hypothetical protein
VEEVGGADKSVTVFEAFEVRVQLGDELVGSLRSGDLLLMLSVEHILGTSCLIPSQSSSCSGCMSVTIFTWSLNCVVELTRSEICQWVL